MYLVRCSLAVILVMSILDTGWPLITLKYIMLSHAHVRNAPREIEMPLFQSSHPWLLSWCQITPFPELFLPSLPISFFLYCLYLTSMTFTTVTAKYTLLHPVLSLFAHLLSTQLEYEFYSRNILSPFIQIITEDNTLPQSVGSLRGNWVASRGNWSLTTVSKHLQGYANQE